MTHHTNNACATMMSLPSEVAREAESQKARRVDAQVIAAEVSDVMAIIRVINAPHEDKQ